MTEESRQAVTAISRQIAPIVRVWLDDPENRLSIEAGCYGDVQALSRLLALELDRLFPVHQG